MAEPRSCHTLILSRRVRSEPHFTSYKPFNDRLLSVLFDEAAKRVAESRRRKVCDKHSVFPYFFFGERSLDDGRKEALGKVPTSVVDCDVYRGSRDDQDRVIAENALFEVHERGDDKTFVYLCGDACGNRMLYDHFQATNDSELRAFLVGDLADNGFAVIGKGLIDGP